jgi:hypothetical protein
MRPHPYLRAYMAGIVVPTVVLLLIVTVFAVFRLVVLPIPEDTTDRGAMLGSMLMMERLGRAIIFPMAVVPNLWGIWNILYMALRRRTAISLGMHGATLPLVLVPLGIPLARAFGVFTINVAAIVPFTVIAMAAYYLIWKYVVDFLNAELGIA